MRLIALLALVVAACAPPPEVDEITSAQTVSDPYASASDIYVGYVGGTRQQTVVLFKRRSDQECIVSGLSAGGGSGASPTQLWWVVGPPAGSMLQHVNITTTVQCSFGETWTLSAPRQDNGFGINLRGGAGDDLIYCMGTGNAVNTCAGGPGNDIIYAQSRFNSIAGEGGIDRIGITAVPVSDVQVNGGTGDDCVTWIGNVAGPSGSGNDGFDVIKSRAASPNSIGYEADDVNNFRCGIL